MKEGRPAGEDRPGAPKAPVPAKKAPRASRTAAAASARLAQLAQASAGIAHEIRNPNNAILAYARMLGEVWADARKILRRRLESEGDFLIGGLSFREEEERIAAMPERIADCARRIHAITETLKDYSNPGELALDEAVPIRQAITGALLVLGDRIKDRTDRFTADLQGNLPAVKGNRQALEQVLINLVANALEALPERRRGVRVSAEHEAGAGRVLIRIEDEGIGLPPPVLARAFEPFFSTKRAQGGLGLGLSISADIVRQHGGTITLDSQPGRNTVVTIALPALAPGRRRRGRTGKGRE